MKNHYEITHDIAASPETVWSALTNRESLAAADNGITRIEGELRDGGRIQIWTEVSPKRAFALRVSLNSDARAMVWEGGMPLGLFRGVRRFEVHPQENGSRFFMQEDFSGLFAGAIVRSMPDLTPSFQKFAYALAASAGAS
ncbi:MAG: SRPBCC family protein [Myxococcota bacterium]